MNYTDDQLEKAAINWWKGCRPVSWKEAEHLQNPLVNAGYSTRSKNLAAAVAKFLLQRKKKVRKVTAERDVLRADLCTFAVDMERQLSAVTAERDALNEEKERLERICRNLEKCVAEGLTKDEAERLRADLDTARATCQELVTDSNAATLAETVARVIAERDAANKTIAYVTNQLIAAGVDCGVAPVEELARRASAKVTELEKHSEEVTQSYVRQSDVLTTSQQEVRMLREALEKCIACLDWFAGAKPDDMGADDEEAMRLAAAALSSTPAPVHTDTERLKKVKSALEWIAESRSGHASTLAREALSAIDAELAKEGK